MLNLKRTAVDFVNPVVLAILVCRPLAAGSDQLETRPDAGKPVTAVGHFVYGFEYSRFIPCNPAALGLESDIRLQAAGIWIWVPPDRTEALQPNVRYFIEVAGILRGPGRFGHLGSAPYELQIEQLLVYSDATPPRCDSQLRHPGIKADAGASEERFFAQSGPGP
jgi:hypothetical protein